MLSVFAINAKEKQKEKAASTPNTNSTTTTLATTTSLETTDAIEPSTPSTSTTSTETNTTENENQENENSDSIIKLLLNQKKQDVILEETIKESRSLLKTLFVGIKSVTYVLLNQSLGLNQPSTLPLNAPGRRLTEEMKLLSRAFKYGLECIALYSVGENPASSEEKEVKICLII